MIDNSLGACLDAVMAIDSERASNPEFQKMLDNLISITKEKKIEQKLNFSELVDLTVELTKQKMEMVGANLNDMGSVIWQMGCICYIWRNSLPICENKFDKIFIASWKKYFNYN